MSKSTAELTIGPILFHWPVETKRDFYFKIADEAPVDTVYLGEVICSKRTPFFEPHYEEVVTRLENAGKRVVFSTLAEVTGKLDRKVAQSVAGGAKDFFVEANDVSALWYLDGHPHAIGPFLNVYNEDTLGFLARKGARHVTLPPELPASAIAALGKEAKSLNVSLEVQVYGRIPLALSARCYHARAHGRIKDTCRFVCEEDPDGMDLKTLEGESILTINGIQTLSWPCLNLMNDMEEMQNAGISAFRLSPHSHDMIQTARLFRAVLDGEMDAQKATAHLKEIALAVPFSNGFYHGREGYKWVDTGVSFLSR